MYKYDPNIHHRRSIRLKGYDYSQAGAYFITICCDDRICRFGEIVGAGLAPAHLPPAQIDDVVIGQPQGIAPTPSSNMDDMVIGRPQGPAPTMQLNEYGKIAYDEWIKLPERYPNFELDVFQIMPNHMHAIILLNDVGAGLARAHLPPAQIVDVILGQPQNNAGQPQGLPLPTIGDIVGAYKSLVANECLKIFKNNNETMGKLWQRNYHEHIIRDEQSYQRISDYVTNNPAIWEDDKFYTNEQ